MPRRIELDGVVHEFPDDASDDEISSALSGPSASAGVPGMERLGALPPAGTRPQVNMQGDSGPMAATVNTLATQGDVATGIGKGVASTMFHGGDVIRRAAGMPRVINRPEVQSAITPQGTAQKVGFGGEQAAEFLAPTGLVGDAGKAIDAATAGRKGVTAARIIGKSIVDALASGSVAGAQTGGDPNAMRNAALASGGTSAVLRTAGAAVPAVKRGVQEVLGKTTGAGAVPVGEAIDNPTPAFKAAMRGKTSEMDVLNDFQDALQNVKDQRGAQYRQALAAIPQNQTLDITPVKQELENALTSHGVQIPKVPPRPTPTLPRQATQAQYQQYLTDVEAAKNWDKSFSGLTPGDPIPDQLDFSRSTIRDTAAQNDVKGIVRDISGWGSKPGDLAPLGVDTLKRRVDDFYSPSSNARALVQRVKGATRNVLNSVPGYQDMTRNYAAASEFLDAAKDLSLESKNPGTAVRKLATALNQNNSYREVLVDALSNYANDPTLKSKLAGLAMSKWAPGGLAGRGTGIGLIYAVMTGHLSPMSAVALAATSPRITGELLSGMSEIAPMATKTGTAATATLPAMAGFGASRTSQ